MTIDMIQNQAILFSKTAYSAAETVSQLALSYFGKAVEWLQVNIPVAMTQTLLLAQRVVSATQPYLITFGHWAVENRQSLTTGSVGVVIGITIASLVFARYKSAK